MYRKFAQQNTIQRMKPKNLLRALLFTIAIAAFSASVAIVNAATNTIYTDSLQGSWSNNSYNSGVNLSDTATGGSGSVVSVNYYQQWGAFRVETSSPVQVADYQALEFDVYSSSGSASQNVQVFLDGSGQSAQVTFDIPDTAGWHPISLSLSSQLTGPSQFQTISFQAKSSGFTVYYDNIELTDGSGSSGGGGAGPAVTAAEIAPAYYFDHETAYVIENAMDTTEGGMFLALDPADNQPFGVITDTVYGNNGMTGTDKNAVGQGVCSRYFVQEYQRISTSGQGVLGINQALSDMGSTTVLTDSLQLLTDYAALCADFIIDHMTIPADDSQTGGTETCQDGGLCEPDADQGDTGQPNMYYYWSSTGRDGATRLVDDTKVDAGLSAARAESSLAWSLAELALAFKVANGGTCDAACQKYRDAAIDYWNWRYTSAIATPAYNYNNTQVGVARDLFYAPLGFVLAEVTGQVSYRDGGATACATANNSDGSLCGAVPFLNSHTGTGSSTDLADPPPHALQDGAYMAGYARAIAFAHDAALDPSGLSDRDQWWNFGTFTVIDESTQAVMGPTELLAKRGTIDLSVPFSHFNGREVLAGTQRANMFYTSFGANPNSNYPAYNAAAQSKEKFAEAAVEHWNYTIDTMWDDTLGQRSWYESTSHGYKPCFSAGTEIPFADYLPPSITDLTHATASGPALPTEPVTFTVTVDEQNWDYMSWQFGPSGVNAVEVLYTCDAGVAASGDPTQFYTTTLSSADGSTFTGTLDGASVDAICETTDSLYYYTRVTDNFGNKTSFSQPGNTGAAIDPEQKVAAENWWYADSVSMTGSQSDLQIIPFADAGSAVQIGNLVWEDDGDGVWQSGESGIDGLTVTLYDITGTVVATTTTVAGVYTFDQDDGVVAGADYTIAVDPTDPALAGLSPVGADAGSPNDDAIDSDGVNGTGAYAGLIVIDMTAPAAGSADFTHDFGFAALTPANITIVKTVEGGTSDADFVIAITSNGSDSDFSDTVSLSADGSANVEVPAGTYTIAELGPLPQPPVGFTWQLAAYEPSNGTITVAPSASATVTVTNRLIAAPEPVTGILTVIKTVDWNGQTENPAMTFDVNVSNDGGMVTTTQITDGGTITLTLPIGTYTVTESAVGAGWMTTYTVGATVTASNAVVELTNTPAPSSVAPTAITGTAYQDHNSNGQFSTGGIVDDMGVAGVTVTAYDASGAAVGSTQTITDGTYTLTPSQPGPWRIEFTTLPSGLEPSAIGTGNGTSVQFVQTIGDATGVNFALLDPTDYVPDDLRLAVSTMRTGAASGLTTLASQYGFISIPYASTGTADATGDLNNPDYAKDVTFATVGTTWGAAYQPESGIVFAGAVMKRHQGLGPLVAPALNAGEQSVPVDGIYLLDYSDKATPSTLGGFTLNNVVPSSGDAMTISTGTVTREIVNVAASTTRPNALSTTTVESYDIDAFSKAGTIGFGDVEAGSDGESLWIVNLNQKSLIKIDISDPAALPTSGAISGSLVSHYAIDFTGLTCNGEYRPWGLAFEGDSGYVGVVCDGTGSGGNAASHASVRAWVLQFDPNDVSAFSDVIEINLDPAVWNRESPQYVAENTPCSLGSQSGWNRWATSWTDLGVYGGTDASFGVESACPQPILSGIDFAENGDMVLGFMDRTDLQMDRANLAAATNTEFVNVDYRGAAFITNGSQTAALYYSVDSGGDTIHVCNTPSGYVTEGFAGCQIDNDTVINGDTPADRFSITDGPNSQGEFYYRDFSSVYETLGGARHIENNLGSVAIVPGSGEVIVTGYDVIEGDFNQGFHWYNTSTGERSSQYQLTSEPGNPTPANQDLNTKGLALGDIELLLDPPPLELGNRVWNDLDGDGVQDANEPGLANVTVSLFDGTGTVTDVTDGDGNYQFAVESDTAYTLTIQTTPAGYQLTQANMDAVDGVNFYDNDSFNDVRDSDAVLVGGTPTIYYTTGSAGQNNHGLDFGFVEPPTGQVALLNTAPLLGQINLGNFVWFDADNNGVVNNNELNYGYAGVLVELYDINDTLVATMTTDADGFYLFEGLLADEYYVRVPAENFTAGQPLANTTSASTDGADPDDNVDQNDNGQGSLGGVDIDSQPITLALGDEPITMTVAGDTNLSVDFGFTAPRCLNANDLGGDIFRDFNHDGINDSSTGGPDVALYASSIIVYAYNDDNQLVAQTNLRPDGTYLFDNIFDSETHVRLEFVGLPEFLNVGYSGVDNGTPTQNHQAGTCGADLGVHNSADYCQTDPDIGVACYENGSGIGNSNPSFVSSPYSADGDWDADNTVPSPTKVGEIQELGVVWGTDYHKEAETIFTFAALRRHSAIGPAGVGGVYMITPSTTDVVSFTLQGVTPSNGGVALDMGTVTRTLTSGALSAGAAGDYQLSSDTTVATVDLDAFAKVGKMGFGDADFDNSGTRLWTVNLYSSEQALIAIDTSDMSALPTDGSQIAGSLVTRYLLADLSGLPTCDDGVFRPWALAFRDGVGYLGGVCSAENDTSARSSLTAHILSFNPDNVAAGLTSEISFDLDYTREIASEWGHVQPSDWQPWIDDWSDLTFENGRYINESSPILSDIEFNADGDMVLGLTDRAGLQAGYQQRAATSGASSVNSFYDVEMAGDILHVCNMGGRWVMENTDPLCMVTDPGNYEDASLANDGPSGAGEYYHNDVFTKWGGGHHEIAAGGLALVPSVNQVLTTVYDPISEAGTPNSQGYRRYDTETGDLVGSYLIVPEQATGQGKSGGLGEPVAMCDLAPLEIGNYIWLDEDGDGIQDPCENGLANVDVVLHTIGNTVVATATTNAAGEYYFNDSNVPGGLAPETSYHICVPLNNNGLDGLFVTQQDYANNGLHPESGNSTDVHDSDGDNGLLLSDHSCVEVTTGKAGENDYTFDFGFVPQLGAIGNYVWLDENADGQQDEGERGIPNVIVNMVDQDGTVYTTTTDADGGYLFPDLPQGTYTVTIPASNSSAGNPLELLEQTPLFGGDADFGNKLETGYVIDLGWGEENLTADFGYNPDPENANDNDLLAALGDYVWIDSDGDGVQDSGETPVAGVELTIYHDPDGDGVYDTPFTDGGYVPTTTTDASGYYLFDSLPASSYKVTVTDSSSATHDVLNTGEYTQTGDPDHFGTTGSNNDNMSEPVVLAPGDSFLNVDFGYQPSGATLGSIGNTVWLDADADMNGPADSDGLGDGNNGVGTETDANEQPIAGVTIALIKDSNGNGAWDVGEPIISTDTTDENGIYLFEGLPLDDDGGDSDADYVVWINDTDNVLAGLKPTFDEDGIATANVSAVAIDNGTPDNRDQDFGYAPEDQVLGLGAIGDTVWFDMDRSGTATQDAGEAGIEGVLVVLTDEDGNSQAMYTDENGMYLFGGLPLTKTYTVTVAPSNFAPGGVLEGMEQTYDQDAPLDHSSTTTLTAAAPVDLEQDFSYTGDSGAGFGRIGNLVWLDPDADGIYEPADGETPIGNVTIDLYRDLDGNGTVDPSEPLFASYLTESVTGTNGTEDDGNYIFENLPLGDYVVDITDENGVLNGYWHSLGTPMADDNSQADPYGVSITDVMTENLTADFGYYIDPAAVGNYVWLDSNDNGLQDDGETGINGVAVQLVIDYPEGTSITLTTVTTDDLSGNAGFYQFTNLLLDEDYRQGSSSGTPAAGQPAYTLSVDGTQPAVASFDPATVDVNSNGNDQADSDNHDGTTAVPVQGALDTAAADPSTDESAEASYDFGYAEAQELGAIGNYVWMDENADGQQDEGERGIPNVIVNMVDQDGTVYTTTTDADGGYLFPDLLAGTYTVTIPASNFATDGAIENLEQTPLGGGDADFGNKDDAGYVIALGEGEENLTADFGYNPDPENANNNDLLAALGDYVWIDSDGDGAQDAGEAPVEGVELTLYSDPDGDGIHDTVVATDTTDANGYYLFDELPAGSYRVTVTDSVSATHDVLNTSEYTQTGDPDHFGTTGSNNDNMSEPVVLAPGDTFLNVDFGYQPEVAAGLNSVGDTIWLDADADGNGPALPPVDGGAAVNQGDGGEDDSAETPISGVTVALIKDSDGDGVWDAGEPIISTDTTDDNGQYLFEGLIDGDYLIWVNDTDNVLDGLAQTYDEDGTTTANISAVDLDSDKVDTNSVDVRDQDFGYAPEEQAAGLGAIGDTVWFDSNRSGDATQGADESGIEGVVVILTDESGITQTTTTDENGNYYFGGLPLDTTYTVTVAASNFITGAVLEGMEQTYDQDAPLDHSSTTTLTVATPIDLDQDFSYVGDDSDPAQVGSIGNRVWLDQNADGDWDGATGPDGIASTDDDETGIAGVTIDLYRDLNGNGAVEAGEPRIGITETISDGTYLFDNLPLGDYVVDVTDENGMLNGYWHSLGAQDVYAGDESADEQDQSKADPIAVNIGEDGNSKDNRNVDFGYYVEPASVGNYVWLDSDEDGLQDADEAGIDGVDVTLVIAYPNGTQITLTTTTGDNPDTPATEQGWYSFDNLMIDEDFNGDGSGSEPTYTISVDSAQPELDGLTETTINTASATGDKNDSDAHNGTAAQPVQGLTDTDQLADPTAEQAIAGYDFGYSEPPVLGAIGNYVWLDENADGMQDEGERGIPNVIVNLTDDGGNVFTTTTDADGGYLFPDLPSGQYTVTIAASNFITDSALAGMEQTPLLGGDADFGNKDDAGYPISLGSGEENLTADFGYNPNPADDVNNNENDAALGDYVWIDSDGDGAQDAGEAPVEGVQVVLFTDPDGDGVYDTPIMTDTTDANGYYLFDGLDAGSYVVTVVDSSSASHDVLGGDYTQTGDPDHFGTTGSNNDNMNDPVVLSPGDVFLNVDFGYQPSGAAGLNSVGDTIWLDADADGTGPSLAPVDGGAAVTQGMTGTADAETPIAGVTVALIKDSDGNGIWDAGEPIISTDTTDENGQYLFEGLADGDYLVWVNDTDNVLDGLTQTYDDDSTATANISAADLDSDKVDTNSVDDRAQDFGYTPAGHAAGDGAIGDTIWLNVNGDTVQDDDEPGIEGVDVMLTFPDGSTITTTTDENGNYYFGGLDPNDTYTVTVITSTLPAGLVNTADPDGGTANQSVVDLSSSGPIDLAQDFGYTPPTGDEVRIGNLVWLDQNADGVWDGVNGPDGVAGTDDDETPIAGVTVDLYVDENGNGMVDAGEPLIASTTTVSSVVTGTFGAGGNYIFEGLPAGDYVVDVTDENGVLNGYWKSDGPNNGDNANSQDDPYAVSVAAGAENLTADFGYYVEPASVGNFVWLDADGDGIQDGGEDGLDGVTVTLQISYPDGTVLTLQTVSGDDPSTMAVEQGWYSFDNLLIDEDFNMGSGVITATSELPGYVISAETPPSYTPTSINVATATNDQNDSDDHAGVAATPVQGLTDLTQDSDPTAEQAIASYDFGFVNSVEIGNYIWLEDDGDGEIGSGEVVTPVVGTVVTATGPDGTVYTGTTDAAGQYTITVPANQTYTITVATPVGMTPSVMPSNPGDNQNHGTEFTVAVGGSDDMTLDIAFTPQTDLYAIGNLVWIDNDVDQFGGIQPNGYYSSSVDTVVSGLTLHLFEVVSGTVASTPIMTTTTSLDGGYQFANLPAGQYQVLIPRWEFQNGGKLYSSSQMTAYTVSPTSGARNTGDDSSDHNGAFDPFRGVHSNVITLGPNMPMGEPSYGMMMVQPDAQTDWTIDFGFYLAEPTSVGVSETGVTAVPTLTAPTLLLLVAIVTVMTLNYCRRERVRTKA